MKNNRSAQLVACALAATVGCATETAKNPFGSTPPKVVAVYAVDNLAPNIYCTETSAASPFSFAFCGAPLPDVLVYSTNAADQGKTSKAPPGYNAFRVEFDQPLNGSTIATDNDLSSASYCSPMAANSGVQLLDVAASNRVVQSSVCYDPSSALGQNPHVTVIVGDGAAFSAAAAPFTCQSFTQDVGLTASAGGNALKPDTQYSFKFGNGIQGTNGTALEQANAVNFTSAGFDIMAVGYQDQNTGYFVWLDKPYAGFMKDLSPKSAAEFNIPNDDTALLIVTTMPVAASGTSASQRRSIANITATRADGSTFAPTIESEIVSAASAANTLSGARTLYATDPRVIAVEPGFYWEPATSYKVSIGAGLKSVSGATIPAASAKTYTFSAPDGSFAKRSTAPASAASAIGVRTDQVGIGAPSFYITFSVPVDPSLADNAHVKLTGPEGEVALSVAADDGSDNQFVYAQMNPAAAGRSPLRPETTYTISWKGLKTPPVCTSPDVPVSCVPANLASKPIADGSSTFTTATFRLADIQRSESGASILRSTSARVDQIATGLGVVYTDKPVAADAQSTDNVKVFEVNKVTGLRETAPIAISISAPSSTGRGFVLKSTDTNYKLKFGQTYSVVAAQAIKSDPSATGTSVNLKAEGCQSGDCSDVATYTTRIWTPLGFDFYDEGQFATGTGPTLDFYFSSSLPTIDPATTDLASHFHVYPVNADGTRGGEVAAGQLNCTFATSREITCELPKGSLGRNKHYIATVAWSKSAPLLPQATLSGHPVDRDPNSPTGGAWFGTRPTTLLTDCTVP